MFSWFKHVRVLMLQHHFARAQTLSPLHEETTTNLLMQLENDILQENLGNQLNELKLFYLRLFIFGIKIF